jgi:hypothetical protein
MKWWIFPAAIVLTIVIAYVVLTVGAVDHAGNINLHGGVFGHVSTTTRP